VILAAFTARGIPQSQGSLNGYVRGGRAVLTDRNRELRPWRQAVTDAAVAAINGVSSEPHDGPVAVHITFALPKPTSAPKRRRTYPRKLDADKGARAILDALVNAGVIYDDNRVVDLTVRKRYVGDPQGLPHPGAMVTVATVEEDAA
jgi:Holliday junction resolvase RusA-like endonuclease